MTSNDDWLAQGREDALAPDLPIVDAHHHLWDHHHIIGLESYLLNDYVADTSSGHNIVASVIVECANMYRTDGPEELRCLGETEFLNGLAAQYSANERAPTASTSPGRLPFITSQRNRR
jgi:L-fuconolactonase